MIIEYHRPKKIEEALILLARKDPITIPLGGGAGIVRNGSRVFAVVDLQNLDLDDIEVVQNNLVIGASASLQKIMDHSDIPAYFKEVVKKEMNYNQRQRATLAGTLVKATGRSLLCTVLYATESSITFLPGNVDIFVSDWAPARGINKMGDLITKITSPGDVDVRFDSVRRTPMDLPILCAAVCKWPSGRVRVALGGFGASPTLAYDGDDLKNASISAENAYKQAEDQWATSLYRSENARILVDRLVNQ